MSKWVYKLLADVQQNVRIKEGDMMPCNSGPIRMPEPLAVDMRAWQDMTIDDHE